MTKHQERKIAKLNSVINYYCGKPVFEISPVINIHLMENTETILIHITNAKDSRWYETRIDFWAYISPRGKVEQVKGNQADKSIYDKHFKTV
jgi:hypothetical protein